MRKHKRDIELKERRTLSRYVVPFLVTKNVGQIIISCLKLEQTVTKLQTALGFSPDDVSAMPPPLIKIRELEQDVARLEKENDELRRLLADSGGRLSVEIPRRNSIAAFQDSRACDRDYKRRKMGGGVEGAYIVCWFSST
jgi:hypothetical protein